MLLTKNTHAGSPSPTQYVSLSYAIKMRYRRITPRGGLDQAHNSPFRTSSPSHTNRITCLYQSDASARLAGSRHQVRTWPLLYRRLTVVRDYKEGSHFSPLPDSSSPGPPSHPPPIPANSSFLLKPINIRPPPHPPHAALTPRADRPPSAPLGATLCSSHLKPAAACDPLDH